MTDTERLDWLESHKDFGAEPSNQHVARVASRVDFSWLPAGSTLRSISANTVRDAIDAAMANKTCPGCHEPVGDRINGEAS